ncbi:MAG: DUF3108 domain-containing protein [Catalinimonas sp.]
MKRRFALLLLPALLIVAVAWQLNDPPPAAQKNSFAIGEKLIYRVHYGFMEGGEAVIAVSDKVHEVNQRPCYKIEVQGRTTGAVRVFYKVRDVWGSYVDTSVFMPHRAYRKIQENNYRKDEVTYFDQAAGEARVVDEDRNQEKVMKTPRRALDLVSGAFYLRTLNYDRMRRGDTVRVQGVFEDKLYDMSIRYLGRERIKTRFGQVKTVHLQPILPDNSLFDGENAIDIYVTDDDNKVPVKIRANMVVGAVEIDLKDFNGLKHASIMEQD